MGGTISINRHYLVQRKEECGWRSIGFPKIDINIPIARAKTMNDNGHIARVIMKETTVVWR